MTGRQRFVTGRPGKLIAPNEIQFPVQYSTDRPTLQQIQTSKEREAELHLDSITMPTRIVDSVQKREQ